MLATKTRSALLTWEFLQGCAALLTFQCNKLRPRMVHKCTHRLTGWRSHQQRVSKNIGDPHPHHILTFLACRAGLNKQLACRLENSGGLQPVRGAKANTADFPIHGTPYWKSWSSERFISFFSLPLRPIWFYNGISSQLLMWVMQFGKKQKGPIIRINILCEGRTKASIKYEAGL